MNTNAWLNMIEGNRKLMEQKDMEAKEKGVLKGRYINEQYADGYAFYEIIRENKKTVRIRVIKNIGDDWVIPYWGEEATIDKEHALKNIGWRDFMANRVAQRSNTQNSS
jgi:hypothetical protein